jgi:hypothetical protein
MNDVFLDTVGLLALWDEDDQWHAEAEAAFERLVHQHAKLITSSFVLLECGNAAARRPYRLAVDDLRREMEAKRRVIVPSDHELRDAWEAYRQGQANQAGIVDLVSFAVMRRMKIKQAFTNDHHFRTAGFETLF